MVDASAAARMKTLESLLIKYMPISSLDDTVAIEEYLKQRAATDASNGEATKKGMCRPSVDKGATF
jgi:hypothetical protein